MFLSSSLTEVPSQKIISRILYFDTHLSRIRVTSYLKRSIEKKTALRHYLSFYHSPCIREGLPHTWSPKYIHLRWTFHLLSLARFVLSLWHFPYSTFYIWCRAKAVSFSHLRGMSRLSSPTEVGACICLLWEPHEYRKKSYLVKSISCIEGKISPFLKNI